MTFAELERALNSKRRIKMAQDKERAAADYILADLVGRSIARVYNSANEMPKIFEVYPSLFSEEDDESAQARQAEVSALRFKQFALAFNARHKEVCNE